VNQFQISDFKFQISIIALILFISSAFALCVYGTDAVAPGTVIIPKRQGDSKKDMKKTDEVLEVVEQIQAKFAKINDIKGTFSQKSYIKDIEQIQ
jgi:outer membrane lipoprotein-sorting protein